MSRIHILIDEVEKARFRLQASREGKSLGAWLRDAARERLRQVEFQGRVENVSQLEEFFGLCDARETAPEPDWSEHRRVIDESRGSGLSAS